MSETEEKENLTKVDYATIEGIQKHPTFSLLTFIQRRWLLCYFRNKMDFEATHSECYPGMGMNLSTRIFNSPYVRELITVFSGRPLQHAQMGRNELATLIAKRLRDSSICDATFLELCATYLYLTRQRVRKTLETRNFTKKRRKVLRGSSANEVRDLVKQIEESRKKKDKPNE